MPIYEYLCEECDVCFEEERSISTRKELATCPQCLQPIAKLIPSLGTFILKGGGWFGDNGLKTPKKP